MKFEQMQYARPDFDAARETFASLRARIAAAPDAQAQLEAFREFETLSRHISTMSTLAEIRHTVDTRDAFYEAEREFFDANSPALGEAQLDVYRALLASPFRTQLEQALGRLTFEKMEVDVKSSDPAILELMAEENALTTAYEKLYASALIEFDGRKNTVSQMSLYKQNPDRAVRKAAYEAEGAWFDAHRAELDELYDKLVKNRTAQARKLGYENFIPLGAIRMRRIGYTLEDMAAYRAQIKKDFVPVVAELKKLQYARTGVADPKFYDDAFCFADGNPAPHGTPEEILAAGREMYHALSPETAEFIDEMFDGGLFDVLSKEGKAPGGYCTYLADYKAPFIFSNFNGTSDDVDVLTHEAGHAFAAWVAARKDLPMILEEPGMESCEIHSMSMEQFAYPYAEWFFGDQADKFRFAHLQEALTFVPFGVAVDEFQHICYAHPELTPKERTYQWHLLEEKYMPWRRYENDAFFARGGYWYHKLHIYLYPFYYINYTLTTMGAMEFKKKYAEDRDAAWQDYLNLCKTGGSRSYLETLRYANLSNPFTPGSVARACGYAAEILLGQIERQEQKG